MVTTARQWSLFRIIRIQTKTLHPISLRHVLILSSPLFEGKEQVGVVVTLLTLFCGASGSVLD